MTMGAKLLTPARLTQFGGQFCVSGSFCELPSTTGNFDYSYESCLHHTHSPHSHTPLPHLRHVFILKWSYDICKENNNTKFIDNKTEWDGMIYPGSHGKWKSRDLSPGTLITDHFITRNSDPSSDCTLSGKFLGGWLPFTVRAALLSPLLFFYPSSCRISSPWVRRNSCVVFGYRSF